MKPPIRVIAALPGSNRLASILSEFSKGGAGTVTALSDLRLRALAVVLPSGGELTLDPFGKVVGEFITRAGGRFLALAQSGHVRAAVAEACLALPEDSVFFPAARFAGTHKKIGQVLDELRGWGVGADELQTLCEKMEGALANKLKSLAFIEAEVSDSLHKIGRERVSDRLAGNLELEPESTDLGRLLIVAGSDLEPLHVQWIGFAASLGMQIHIVVDRSASNAELFRGASALLPPDLEVVEHDDESNQLLINLFGTQKAGGNSIQVEISSAADPLAEAEWAVRSVLADLENGVEPHSVAIYSRDPETYVPLVEAAAARLGLALSSSRRLPLLGNSFARLMLDVLDFCAGEDVRMIGRVLRSSYLSMADEQRAAVYEAAKESFRSGDEQWAQFASFATGGGEEIKWLVDLLQWRKSTLGEAAKLGVWIDRIRDFGQQPWHEAAIDAKSHTSARDGYAQSALQRTLAQYATIEQARGGRRYTLQQFARFCRRIWEEAQVSTPSALGAVQVVSSTLELGPISALYVLGMLEGVFPRRRSEDPILTDAERALISQRLGLQHALQNSHTKAFAEREEFYRLCGAPTDKLVLSYPETEDDRDNVPAFYLTEVERAMDGAVQKINHRRTELTPSEPALSADVMLATALNADKEKPLANVLDTPDAMSAVSKAAKQALTVKDLSDILECPFRYLAESNLDLHPNRRRSRWHHLYRLPNATGLATHEVRESAQLALEKQLDAETSRLFPEAALHDLALIRSGGKRLISEWLDREFASRELWPREAIIDHPTFERGDLRSKLKADDGFVFLSGGFPALSTRDGYRILHLFKASEPWDDQALREVDPWFRLKKKSAFEIGLLMLALTGSRNGVGVEIDSSSGARNLFVSPRPERPFPSNQLNGFKVTVVDRDRSKDIFAGVFKDVRKALNRINTAQIEPPPGEHCRTCEYGELCRRSVEFGEEVDPFESDEFGA